MVKKLLLIMCVVLSSVAFVNATPVKRVIAAGLQKVLSRELVAQIRNDALNGNLSKIQASRNVEKLVAQGADVNAIDEKTGESAVTVATWFSTPEIAAYLLASGADPNHQDITKFFGRTALHAAATRESSLFAYMLLSFGGQVNVADKEGKMPIEYAAESVYIDNVVALANNGAVVPRSVIENLQRHLDSPKSLQEREKIHQALAICTRN